MEDLSTALFYDTVPDTWVARAYPSMMGLAAWYADLLQRIRVSHGTLEPPGTFVPWPQSPRQPPWLTQVGRPGSVPQTSDFPRRDRTEASTESSEPHREAPLSMQQRQEQKLLLGPRLRSNIGPFPHGRLRALQ